MAWGNISNALRYVPLCLTGSTRTWLNGLPPSFIHSWTDFESAFVNNFEETYQFPDSAYGLHNYIQGDKELVCNFISRWLKNCNS